MLKVFVFLLSLSTLPANPPLTWSGTHLAPINPSEITRTDIGLGSSGNGAAAYLQMSGELAVLTFNQPTNTWVPPLILDGAAVFSMDNNFNISVNSKGHAAVVWLNSVSSRAVYSTFDGAAWSTPANAEITDPSVVQTITPNIAMGEDSVPVFTCVQQYTSGNFAVYVRRLDGSNVGRRLSVSTTPKSNPVVQLDDPSFAVVVFQAGDFEDTLPYVYYIKSHHGGADATFSIPKLIFQDPALFSCGFSLGGKGDGGALIKAPSFTLGMYVDYGLVYNKVKDQWRAAPLGTFSVPVPPADLPPKSGVAANEGGDLIATWTVVNLGETYSNFGAAFSSIYRSWTTPHAFQESEPENFDILYAGIDACGNGVVANMNLFLEPIKVDSFYYSRSARDWSLIANPFPVFAATGFPSIAMNFEGLAAAFWWVTGGDDQDVQGVVGDFSNFCNFSPANLKGNCCVNRFASQKEISHCLTWEAPEAEFPVKYLIREEGRIVAKVPGKGPLKVCLNCRVPNWRYTYAVSAVYPSGFESAPVEITLGTCKN